MAKVRKNQKLLTFLATFQKITPPPHGFIKTHTDDTSPPRAPQMNQQDAPRIYTAKAGRDYGNHTTACELTSGPTLKTPPV